MINHNGLFVTFEGGEGSGKSSAIADVAKKLVSLGYPVVLTREPGGSNLGNTIRQWILDPRSKEQIGQKAELLLFLAARAQHLQELIIPSLNAGKVVLCDRFNDSTVAYQGGARGLGMDSVEQLCEIACSGLQPNLTLLFDVDPKIGLARAKSVQKEDAPVGSVDRMESEHLEFHLKVRQSFLSLASKHPDRIRLIDASQPLESVCNQALNQIQKMLTKNDL